MTVTESLLAALRGRLKSGETFYAIGKAAGVDQQIISRFVSEERKQIRSETIDRLCEYLGLELRPAKTKRGK